MSFWPQLTLSSVSIVNITHIKIVAQGTPKVLIYLGNYTSNTHAQSDNSETVVRVRINSYKIAKAVMMACSCYVCNTKEHNISL